MSTNDLDNNRELVELVESEEHLQNFAVVDLEESKSEPEPDILRLNSLCELIQEVNHSNLLDDDSFQQLVNNALMHLDLTSDGEVRLFGVSLSRMENWACGDELPKPSVRRVFGRWILQRAEEEVELAGG